MDTGSSDRTACAAVIEAVAAHEGIEPTDLDDPLVEAIDPEGLNTICQDSSVCVSFEYHGYLVTIDSENHVDLTDATPS